MLQFCRGVRVSEFQRITCGEIPDNVGIFFQQNIAAVIVRECEKFLKVSASEKNRVSGDQKIVAGDRRKAEDRGGGEAWIIAKSKRLWDIRSAAGENLRRKQD